MIKRHLIALLTALLLPGLAWAQQNVVVADPTTGNQATVTGHALNVNAVFTPTGTQNVNLTGVGGAAVTLGSTTSSASVPVVIASDQGAVAVKSSPASRTLVTLDVKTVTTGGTAVTALSAGHRTAGGWLQNPIGATVNLCINEIGTASGTTSSGDTTCIQPGQSYTIAPAAGAVSVITSDSLHPYSGMGYQ